MMLGFKDRFVPMIEDGSKRHTIRAGARWKDGMRADLYARPRQKGMRLLFRATVTRVESIEILLPPDGFTCPLCGSGTLHHHQGYCQVRIGSTPLCRDEANLLAWRDGFRANRLGGAFDLMMEYWRGDLPFTGQLIHWDYDKRFRKIEDTCYRVSEWMARGPR